MGVHISSDTGSSTIVCPTRGLEGFLRDSRKSQFRDANLPRNRGNPPYFWDSSKSNKIIADPISRFTFLSLSPLGFGASSIFHRYKTTSEPWHVCYAHTGLPQNVVPRVYDFPLASVINIHSWGGSKVPFYIDMHRPSTSCHSLLQSGWSTRPSNRHGKIHTPINHRTSEISGRNNKIRVTHFRCVTWPWTVNLCGGVCGAWLWSVWHGVVWCV